ncbi:MAG: branched-chain amino acid ABC transporter permease [Deltaproteobacteria bacterium]|nr:branched-chain amino acid ABC transporter permease [Deltaproteobacteria bacterium]
MVKKEIYLFGTVIAILMFSQWIISKTLNPYLFMILMYCGINIILGVSLNIINGLTGQFSIGHAGFMAIGGYVSAAFSFYFFAPWISAMGLPFWLQTVGAHFFFLISLFLGGLTAAGFGYVVGLPSLHLRGDYLGIVTLGFGEIIRVLILNLDVIGGARGFTGIPSWSNFFWVYFFVVCVVLLSFRLVRSYHGRALLAIRENEIAAEAMGINITAYKVKAFMLSSFFAGIAGGLFAHYIGYLNPSSFTFIKSFEAIVIVVLGGMGSISGAVLAALITTILPEALRPLQEVTRLDFRMVIYPLLLLTLMLTRPQGILGTKEIGDVLPFLKRKSR